jgi:hypothetical protein
MTGLTKLLAACLLGELIYKPFIRPKLLGMI